MRDPPATGLSASLPTLSAALARRVDVNRLQGAVVAIILVLACAALLLTAPVVGDFWWSDAPRHALNGAFVEDFVAAFPWRNPVGWAYEYYIQYPALSILFYPPLFYVIEAVVYALLGVSHFAAQVSVTLFVFVLAVAGYGISRFLLPQWSALGASLLLIGAPETAFWGRQVLLDVPAYAALAASVFFFVRYLRDARGRDVYFSALCMLAAVYIKLNTVFILPVLVTVFLLAKRKAALRDRAAIGAAVLGAVGLVPALLLTWRFGMVNVQSVVGRAGDLPRDSIQAWLFYLKDIPHQLGYVPAILGVCGIGLVALRRVPPREGWFACLLLGWLGFGYVFFSMIGVREPRHILMILFPLVLGAILALHWLLPPRLAQGAALVLGGAVFVHSLLLYPPPVVSGYAAVADYVAVHAAKNAVVLFSGYRDGNFVFDMRTHEERRDISTLRADKLLLRIAIERIRGMGQADYTQDEIAKMLRDLGVDLVIYQPGFWEDLREMSRLAAVIQSPAFARVASFGITGKLGSNDADQIEIYRPTHPVEGVRRSLQLDLPIIRQKVEGTIGASGPLPGR